MQNIRHITPGFAVSPQITAAQLAGLGTAGFTTVICNRPDHEEPGQPAFAQIRAAAEAAGLQAHHIPIISGQPATSDDLAAFHTALNAASGKVLAYCRSGARSQSLFTATQG